MFTATQVIAILDSRLDAEGSDYFHPKYDYEPSINSAQRWLLSLIDSARHSTKRADEALRELKRSKVYQTTSRSRINLSSTLWTIDAVMPLPVTSPAWTVQANGTPDTVSLDLSATHTHISSNHWADENNVEEWAINSGNPFAPGNIIDKCIPDTWTSGDDSNVQFAYLNHYDYDNGVSKYPVIEIRPYLDELPVTVFYTENPTDVVYDVNTSTWTQPNIYFPVSVMNLLVEKTLQFLAYEQGDQTRIWEITQKDIGELIKSL